MTLRTWWTAWGEMVRKFAALALSLGSMAELLRSFLPPLKDLPWWAVVLLGVAVFAAGALVVLEFLDRRGRRVYARTDADGIKRYMHDWIQYGSRVAIWTRDMSWANNPETRQLLTEKARRNELVVCLPEINDLAMELKSSGAEVCNYGASLLESPASRFTIAYLGRDGSRVAVGRAEGDAHVIDEFSAGDHPAFHLAADLVTLVRGLQGRQNR